MTRFSASAGIAIGPILFVIAILGVLAMAMSSNMGNFSSVGIIDRVSADVTTQANLIRSKINECNMMYGTDSNGDGYPASDVTNGTLVSALVCQGDLSAGYTSGNLWSGARNTQYPPPTPGFNEWTYVNNAAAGKGRCFWTTPKNTSGAIGMGLTKAATKFTSSEVGVNATTQRFVVIITPPSSTPSLCTP